MHGASAFDKENILFGAAEGLLSRLRDCALPKSDKGFDVGERFFGLAESLGERLLPIFVDSREFSAMAGHAAHVAGELAPIL